MADREQHRQQQLTVHRSGGGGGGGEQPTEGIKSLMPRKGISRNQVMVLVGLLPVGGTLFILAGLTLLGTLTGLAIATPIFIIFSPILVPAALTIGLSVLGFLSSAAFGITALSSLLWLVKYLRRTRLPDQAEHVKQLGQKTKETGQAIRDRARETTTT